MEWKDHSVLKEKHSLLSASNYAWLRYDEEKFERVYRSMKAKELGTRKHALAAELISLGQKLPRTRQTLNMYVNDAIGFGMKPEVVLFYSMNAFGTADAISFNRNLLRIHDLKTGVTKASMDQLKIYASYFCLEYNVKPGNIDMELRIYQNDDIFIEHPEASDILPIIDKIITFDKAANRFSEEDSL